MLMNASILKAHYDQGVDFLDLIKMAEFDRQPQWHDRFDLLALDAAQTERVQQWNREMHVLCMTGPWCGDCALQGAAMQRIVEANPSHLHLRFIPRIDKFAELIVANPINAGFRVPITWFMSEDFEHVSRIGDRTLSRYRSIARKTLGDEANVLASPPENPVRAVLDEILDEFERVALLLALSPRLRKKHGD